MDNHKGYEIISREKDILYKDAATKKEENLNIQRIKITFPFLGSDGEIIHRSLTLYLPGFEEDKVFPVIIAVHYEIVKEDPVLYDFLKNNWAVLTPSDIPTECLANIVEDDLWFNMAVIDLARRIPSIDRERVALRGGSAGGYQTMMLSESHLGINCGYNMSGVLNLSYQFKYLIENNEINIEYSPKLSEELANDANQYPIPAVKAIYDGFYPTGHALGEAAMESEKWYEHSPISHLEAITHPILMLHSTADAVVPIYQVTEQKAYDDYENDIPQGYKLHLKELITNNRLRQPMDEIIPSENMKIYKVDPSSSSPEVHRIEFAPDKLFNLTIIDEGKISKMCSHVKNPENIKFTELPFFQFYLEKPAASTNILTFEKLKNMAERYLGRLPLLNSINIFKEQCEPWIFGSLCSDRLDVIIGIMVYIGMAYPKKEYNRQNFELFMDAYRRLDVNMQFFDIDLRRHNKKFEDDPLVALEYLLKYYSDKCSKKS